MEQKKPTKVFMNYSVAITMLVAFTVPGLLFASTDGNNIHSCTLLNGTYSFDQRCWVPIPIRGSINTAGPCRGYYNEKDPQDNAIKINIEQQNCNELTYQVTYLSGNTCQRKISLLDTGGDYHHQYTFSHNTIFERIRGSKPRFESIVILSQLTTGTYYSGKIKQLKNSNLITSYKKKGRDKWIFLGIIPILPILKDDYIDYQASSCQLRKI